MERFGYMDYDRQEYVVTTPQPSKSQENFLFNDRYYTCVNQSGNGYSRFGSPDGLYTSIISGPNEPYYEPSFQINTRLIYLRDDETGESWNVGYFPTCRSPDEYEARHGAGYTIVRNVTDDVEASWRLFVPASDDPVEVWTVSLRNIGDRLLAPNVHR